MKRRTLTKLLAAVLCAALLIPCMPFAAFAESAEVRMVEGDVTEGFVPAGTKCTSSDPSVAWVDSDGNLNAMKEGSVTVSDGQNDYTVTVSDYEDGSEVVGRLKLLARYNDSMQFYDGHVYLLFTSYQDGVTITVPDLYACFDISDNYYDDIREDISAGSNHTGTDAYDYFSQRDDLDSVTLDRGEIVTIGMYRGFELSVAQAALGVVTGSSLWAELVSAGKAAAVNAIFDLFNNGKITADDALARFKTVIEENGLDYTKLLDGFVAGGVCFNRELYNQKLEWDQYENVTYELDITRDQLDALADSLAGNNGRFSIVSNSCATVAMRAWNAAVGMRNGEKTSYYLSAKGSGIYSFMDAPKGVRENIIDRLPGYYLNNSQGVAEPDAGYQDDTGWVYVSAPEKVAPVSYVYDDDSIVIDDVATDISDLIVAAKGDNEISYAKDAQEIGVSVSKDIHGDYTTISGVDFTVNGVTVTLGNDNIPEDGVGFAIPTQAPADDEYIYLLDPDGGDVWGYYDNGYLYIHTTSFPITYRTATGKYSDEVPTLAVNVYSFENEGVETLVYYKDGDEDVPIIDSAPLSEGTKVYIKSSIPDDDGATVLHQIILNNESILNDEHYDAGEGAYFMLMPGDYSDLSVYYTEASMSVNGEVTVQMGVGDVIDLAEHFSVNSGYEENDSVKIAYEIGYDPYDGTAELSGSSLTGLKYGGVFVKAYAASNPNLCDFIFVEVYDDFDEMCTVTLGENYKEGEYRVTFTFDEDEEENTYYVPYSGYRVSKEAKMSVQMSDESSKALVYVMFNNKSLAPGETFTVTGDTDISVRVADARITGMPRTIRLDAQGDTYQLEPELKYTGIWQLVPAYDGSFEYGSSDTLVEVDENGLITVVGEVPEEGAVAYVTAFAGSTNRNIYSTCKVVLGDFDGERIVGSLTISARPITMKQFVSHAMVTFTSYEDVDLDISCCEYFEPTEKYRDLMQDYANHPEDYSSDPALYNDNELGIDDRESYFDIYENGAGSEPQQIHVGAGDSITISSAGLESSDLMYVLTALENSTLSSASPQAQELIGQIKAYMNGEDYDGTAAFNNIITTLTQMIGYTSMLGFNPVDGVSNGGIMINREAYNQFVEGHSQLPNQYYTVDITADELAKLRSFLADPDRNYYSLFNMNCANVTVDAWNTTLSDRAGLSVSGNITGYIVEATSLYLQLLSMKSKDDIDGKGGENFYPRIVACEKQNGGDDPDKPDDPDDPDNNDEPEPVYLNKWYLLGDSDGDGEVSILDATNIQRYLAGIVGEECIDLDASRITEDSVNILDATFIQRYLAGLDAPYPIDQRFNRATGEPVESIDETVIIDSDGVRVTAGGFGRGYLPYLELTVENTSDKDVGIGFEPVIVNGFSVSADFVYDTEDGEGYTNIITVPANSTEDHRLIFTSSMMFEDHMEFVTQITLVARVTDTENGSLIAKQKATVNTSARGSFERDYDESGDAVYDEGGIKFIYKGYPGEDYIDPTFYVSNRSDKDILIRAKEIKVNGAEDEGIFNISAYAGSKALSTVGLFGDHNSGDTVQIVFEICELAENYDDSAVLYTTDAFSFTL